uniref:tyrosine-type recombinase/integrase n=1 Tax=Alistipes sp. TaxID=1872444 RepID=UPI0040568323
LFRYLSAFGNSQANDLVTELLPKTVIYCVVYVMRDKHFLLFLNHLRLLYSNLKSFALLLNIHLARHTFATTVTLTNGVPIESVSKMLGHRSLKTTQIYAKIVNDKLAEDI